MIALNPINSRIKSKLSKDFYNYGVNMEYTRAKYVDRLVERKQNGLIIWIILSAP